MFIHSKKVSENDNEVVYEFFNESTTKNGQFIFFKDICLNNQSEKISDSAKLITPIEPNVNSDFLYVRAIACVMKAFRKTGIAPENASFYGAG